MITDTNKSQRLRIRKSGFLQELYLNRNGAWGKWQDAAVFNNQQAADDFAKKQGVTDHGLF